MAMTNAQRQKAYRERQKAHGARTATLSIHDEQYYPIRALGAKLRQAGPPAVPFPVPVTEGEAAVLLQVLRSIRAA